MIFNQNDIHDAEKITISSGDALSEGKRDKVIQNPEINATGVEKLENNTNIPEHLQAVHENEDMKKELQKSSTIPFLTVPEPQNKTTVEIPDDDDTSKDYWCGQRTRKPKAAYKAMNDGMTAAAAVCDDKDPMDDPFITVVDDDEDYSHLLPPDFALIGGLNSGPRSIDEALCGPDAQKWQEVLDYEINQLEKLGTWRVKDLPAGHTVIPCSEALKIKRGPDGEIQSYHVHIVAGGHRQIEGLNYTEMFSAAAKMPTVCVVLANAAELNWEIEHIDVKSAYLNADLEETVYMRALRGVLKPGQEGKVLRLLKGLYGLKQAGRGWYLEMSRVLMKVLGFKHSRSDHSVFYKKSGDEHTIFAMAIDDMAVTTKHKADAEKLKSEIRKHWEITDHGPIKRFLGFKIQHDQKSRTISINQHAYIEKMVEHFGLTNSKQVSTPMEPNAQFSLNQCLSIPNQVARMHRISYSEAIGSALCAIVVSRPDRAYTIRVLAQFIQNPGFAHWEALKRLITYLGSTKDYWLTFGGR